MQPTNIWPNPGLAIAVLIISFSVGCSQLPKMAADPFAAANDEAKPEKPSCMVVLHSEWWKPKVIKMPLEKEGAVHLQDAVKKSGATSRFRHMDVALLRRSRASGQAQRMEAKYDPLWNHVTPETDYALMPDDRVIIKEKSWTVFDQMFGAIFKPAQMAFGSPH